VVEIETPRSGETGEEVPVEAVEEEEPEEEVYRKPDGK